MKNLLQSMSTRVFLFLIAGVILSVALTLGLALGERQRMIGQFRDYHAVERVAQFVLSLETVPAPLHAPLFNAATAIGIQAEPATSNDQENHLRSRLGDALGARLPDGYRVAATPLRKDDCAANRGYAGGRRHAENKPMCEALLITLIDGSRVRLAIQPPRPPSLAPRVDVATYGTLFLLSIGLLAALVARMTMRPLKQLAQAATDLGNNPDRPPLPERGAWEIRQAASAFNAMQYRIRQHIKQRAHILAAITHDLQTPMTRMRLRLEKVTDQELKDKLVNDLSAMQGLVREGLDLVRSMDSAEPMQQLDLDSLVDSVCADAVDAGQEVSVDGASQAAVTARPMALRRCLANLVDNAAKYGNRAEVAITRIGSDALIRIKDTGPGLPENELEKVFEPFYRLEDSRSRNTGGTGLGLTIAKNIAEQHNGTIKLGNHPDGGLEVLLRLPCRPALHSPPRTR